MGRDCFSGLGVGGGGQRGGCGASQFLEIVGDMPLIARAIPPLSGPNTPGDSISLSSSSQEQVPPL